MPSRKIVQLNNEEVFENLLNGKDVIAYDWIHNTLSTLLCYRISEIKEKLEDDSYIFFMIVGV